MRKGIFLVSVLVFYFTGTFPKDGTRSVCPLVKIEVERLPDMNIPRSAHSVFCVNGEVTVVGRHTTNFIPTATAEYYRDGQWHLVETAFPHDNGISIVLSSGKVLIGGGSEKALGIGQTFPVEDLHNSQNCKFANKYFQIIF